MNKINKSSLFKNSIIILMISLVAIFVSGCSLFGGDDETDVVENVVQEKHIGILRSLGGMSVGDSTHLLEENDGTTIRLRSQNIDLNSDKYLTQKVEVRGVITKTDDGKLLMEVKSIDLSENTNEEDSTTGGVEIEYINAELGFKLKYLDNWEVEDDGGKAIFKSPEIKTAVDPDMAVDETDVTSEPDDVSTTDYADATKDIVTIQKLQNPDKQPLDEFLELPSDPNELITLGYTETLIGIDRLEGFKKQSSDSQKIDIYITRDKYVYYIQFKGANTEKTIDNRNVFLGMTASFQTIGFTDIDTEETGSASDSEISEHQEIPTEFTEPTKPIEEPTENTPTPGEVDTPKTASTSNYADISNYISGHINSIAPESSENGSWAAYSFEYVDPNYVYVEYSDGTDKRRVLLTYDGNEVDPGVVGYFEPGVTTSWAKVSGENPVATSEKTIVSYDEDEGVTTETVVKEGYRYFESLPYDFLAQYPSNWR
ncbi:hypothetical protein KKD70_04380, partial [Patescibacteria group bacterium]|nr:hypothetical protein [Patescibacteria group bacterium]